MNGFGNSLLTFLLSWLKPLAEKLWRAISTDGGTFFPFLTAHWKALVVFLCIAGVVIDAIIYFFRWRPDYLWFRKKKPKDVYFDDAKGQTQAAISPSEQGGFSQPDKPDRTDFTQTRQAASAASRQGFTRPMPAVHNSNRPLPTQRYAPAVSSAQATNVYQRPAAIPIRPVEPVEPVFDDDGMDWNNDKMLPHHNPAADMASSFGQPQPEPIRYIRDMQAGFARPLPPEELYKRPSAPAAPAAPVHPGLDPEAFRQNVGIPENYRDFTPNEEFRFDDEVMHPAAKPPAFHPFTAVSEEDKAKELTPLARFAQKARNFVGGEDDERKLTIRDIHSNVDVSQAFHEPVYPQNRAREDEHE